jgi:hypothetical protein
MLYLWVVAAVTCLWMLPPRSAEQAERAARHVASGFCVAAVICSPFAVCNVARGRAPFAYYHLSLLAPLLCLVTAAAVLGVAWVIVPLRARNWRLAVLRSLCVTLALLTPLLIAPLRAGVLGGLGFVGRTASPFVAEIRESTPLLATALTRGFAEQHVGYGHLLLPPLLLLLAVRCLRNRERGAGELLVVVWGLNVTLLAFLQARFLYYAAPLVAATPIVLAHATGRTRVLGFAAAAFCLAAIWPAPAYYWAPLFEPNGVVPLAQIAAARLAFLGKVRQVTPSAGDVNDPEHRPLYGIFAPWELGHELLFFAQRAVVANNYGDQLEGGSYRDARRIFDEIVDERQAVDLLHERRCRYLLTTAKATLSASQQPGATPLASRLHLGNGSDLSRAPGSGRFRLVALSAGHDAMGLFEYKLFQIVPGAELVLAALPEPDMRVVARVQIGGERFDYVRAVEPDTSGVGHVRVGYAGEYRIISGKRELGRIVVSAHAVEAGASLHLGRAP